MPRRARLSPPNVPLHLIQRGNNRQACFFSEEDYRFYLEWLAEYPPWSCYHPRATALRAIKGDVEHPCDRARCV